jgi:lincosamide nucleotidyltransferase A/C/D/E
MMSEQDVVDLLNISKQIDIPVWIDGGWGVDALVGRQTRQHNDVDVFVELKNGNKFIQMLLSKDYNEVKMDYTTENHTVWQDSDNRVIDLHLFEIKEDGFLFDGETYPSDTFDGKGTISGIPVRCLTAEAQLLYHQGYEHSEKDAKDVLLLCETFGFNIPEQYKLSES